jgi:hypothetical protein
MQLGALFGRLKVKNTFVEVGYDTDDSFYAGEYKQQSEPVLVTEKLLGSSFARILDSQHSDLMLGATSFTKTASFCASVQECETEWEPGEESSGIEWSDMESMVRHVIDEPCHTLDVSAPISLVDAFSIEAAPETIDTEQDSCQVQVKSKSRRRRKRDSLIDKAAKAQQHPPANASSIVSTSKATSPTFKICSSCGVSCEPTFKFCKFCGTALA